MRMGVTFSVQLLLLLLLLDSCLEKQYLEVIGGDWLDEELVHASVKSLITELFVYVGCEAADVGPRQSGARVNQLEQIKHLVNFSNCLWPTQPELIIVAQDQLEGWRSLLICP